MELLKLDGNTFYLPLSMKNQEWEKRNSCGVFWQFGGKNSLIFNFNQKFGLIYSPNYQIVGKKTGYWKRTTVNSRIEEPPSVSTLC